MSVVGIALGAGAGLAYLVPLRCTAIHTFKGGTDGATPASTPVVDQNGDVCYNMEPQGNEVTDRVMVELKLLGQASRQLNANRARFVR